jgi:quercetin dioxygenase-like cupin family protein
VKLYKWNQVPVEQLGGGITRQLITAENLMLSKVFVPKGVAFPAHKLSSEHMTIFVKGTAVYESDDETIEASEGDVVYIPAGIEHSDKVTEDTIVLDIFSPPRRDWLKT